MKSPKLIVIIFSYIFLTISCERITNGKDLSKKDIERIENLGILDKDEKIINFYSEFKKNVAGNFYTNKRLASYWIDEDDSIKNQINSAFYEEVISIDTVYYSGLTYSPYLLITKIGNVQFKVCFAGKREELKTIFDQVLSIWNSNRNPYLHKENWLHSFDFDGDKINDEVSFDFTGGAHCCYKMQVILSSNKREYNYPFQMDGGYLGAVDNSLPDKFNILDIDSDGLPEIIMKIETYNDQMIEIPREWYKEYGIKTNYIMFEFFDGKFITKDYQAK